MQSRMPARSVIFFSDREKGEEESARNVSLVFNWRKERGGGGGGGKEDLNTVHRVLAK